MSLSRIAQTELEQKLKVEYPSENNTKFPYVNTLYLYSSNKQVSQKWTVFFNYKWLKSIKSQTGEYSSETATFRKKTAVFNSGSVLVFFRNSPSTSISTVKTQSKQHSMVHSMACTWPAHGLHMACSVCKHCKLGESSSSNPFSKSKKPCASWPRKIPKLWQVASLTRVLTGGDRNYRNQLNVHYLLHFTHKRNLHNAKKPGKCELTYI